MKRFIRSISAPSNHTSCTRLHTRAERVTIRLKCLAQEHNTMLPARAGSNPTARSGVERTRHEVTANMTHPERPCFCMRQKCILVFAYRRMVHVENKSYPKITKLGQNGSFINLYHHYKYDKQKLTEACTGFSVSEICWFARAREGSHNIVTVGIGVTIMWPVGTFVSICKAKNKKRNRWPVNEDFRRRSEGVNRIFAIVSQSLLKILWCDDSC